MHAFNVIELFQIGGRGVVVVTDKTYEALPRRIALKIGDEVEFRQEGQIVLKTFVAGIEHCDPWTPKHHFAFLLPPDVMKQDIPVGSEIWISIASLLRE
jgi:hypothetical protein